MKMLRFCSGNIYELTKQIKDELKKRNATGLSSISESCGCGLDDLIPCGGMDFDDCVPAYAVLCGDEEATCGKECLTYNGVCFLSCDKLETPHVFNSENKKWLDFVSKIKPEIY